MDGNKSRQLYNPNTVVEDEEISFIAYVQRTIEDLENKLVKVRGGIVYPAEIDRLIATYTKTSLDLLAISEKYIELLDLEQEEFDVWWSEKFVEIRDKLVGDGRSKTKFPSQKEIECDLKFTYKEEYLERSNQLRAIKHKKEFIDRVISRWDKEQWMISSLNGNSQTERRSLKLSQDT